MEDLSKYPKVLSTREDYEFIRNNFPRKYWVEDYKTLLTDSFFVYPVAPVYRNTNLNKSENKDKSRIFVRGRNYDLAEIRRSAKKREKYTNIAKMVKDEANTAELYIDVENTGEIFGCKINSGEDIREFSDGSLYVCRTQELPDSKIRRLGYTPDEIFDHIIGISEEELEEKGKELERKTEEAVDRILESAGMSREDLENDNIEICESPSNNCSGHCGNDSNNCICDDNSCGSGDD